MSDENKVVPFKRGFKTPKETIYGATDGSTLSTRKRTKKSPFQSDKKKVNTNDGSSSKSDSETPEVFISVNSIKDSKTSSNGQSDEEASSNDESSETLPVAYDDEGNPLYLIHRTPKQLARQEEVFRLSVIYGMNNSNIAKKLNISHATVTNDLAIEQASRVEELATARDSEKVRQLMLCQDLINLGRESRNNPGTGAFAAMTKGIEMRAKLLGLDAPTRMEIGVVNLLEAIDVLPRDEQVTQWQRVVSAPQGVLGAAAEAQPINPLNARDPYDPHAREPATAIIDAVARGIVDTPLQPLDTLLGPATGQEATLSQPLASAADIEEARRAAAVREAQGDQRSAPALEIRTDPRTNVVTVRDARPPADPRAADPILSSVRSVAQAAKVAAESREQARNSELTVAHTPGQPPLQQQGKAAKANPDAKALAIMSSDWFLLLPPATQAEVVRAARASATAQAAAEGSSTAAEREGSPQQPEAGAGDGLTIPPAP